MIENNFERFEDCMKGPMKLYCDNKSTIDIAYNVQHDCTKHVEVDKHFIKQKYRKLIWKI